MKTSSAKQKARLLQQWLRDKLLAEFPTLKPADIRSTSMGAQGEDVQLSPAARLFIPYQFETKAYAKFAVYGYYDQAVEHGDYSAVVIIKGNHKKPLAIIDAEEFIKLIRS